MPRAPDLSTALLSVLAMSTAVGLHGQATGTPPQPPTVAVGAEAPLPDPRALLLDAERNDKRLEALRRDYTYHVHLERQQLNKNGGVKKAEITDSESLAIQGVRVNRVVARNGKPLTPEEQAKESERVDKDVAKAREREAKAVSKGEETDDRGDTVLSVSRILELGSFRNERRVLLNGRPTLQLDYAGDPAAKTRSAGEGAMRDLVGTVWIDETDRVLVKGEGHFLNDFKIGGGLIADVRKGAQFTFEARRLADAVWLPAAFDGSGSVRLLLFAGFNGRVHLVTSDYKRFHTSATILPGQSKVDANGNRIPEVGVKGPVPTPSDPQPRQRP